MRATPADSAAYLRRRYVDEGATQQQLADELGVSDHTIRRRLADAGIPARPKGTRARRAVNRERIRRRYLTDGLSMEALAAEMRVGRDTLRRWMDEHGIERRKAGQSGKLDPVKLILDDPAWLATENEKKSIRQLADELGTHVDRVSRAMKRHGLVTQRQHAHRLLDDRVWLARKYIDEGRSAADIAAILEVHGSTVGRALKRLGINRNFTPT